MNDAVLVPLLLALSSVALAGLWMLVRQSRTRRSTGLFMFAALPLALLFLVVPVPLIALQTIMSFRALAGARRGQVLEGVALGILRPSWAASVGCVVTLAATVAMWWLANRRVESAVTANEAEPAAPIGLGQWIVVCSAILVVPVLALSVGLAESGSLIAETSATLSSNAAARIPFDSAASRDRSYQIAARLMIATAGGFLVSFVVLGSAAYNVFASRDGATSDRLEKLSWLVFGLVTIVVVWHFFSLTSAIGALSLSRS